FALGTTLTVAQPTLFSKISPAITDEAKRGEVTDKLNGILGDTDDISVSFHVAPVTPDCTLNLLARGGCWGRDPKAYRDALSTMLLAVLLPTASSTESTTAFNDAQTLAAKFRNRKFSEFSP